MNIMHIKRSILILLTSLLSLVVMAAEPEIRGPQGRIAYKITLPEGFNPATDRCPMVLLMHGIFASKDFVPMPLIAKELAKAGIASIRFDFDGHGKSQGRTQDMTIPKELADARAVWEYVRSLPYVGSIGLLGHSQGGVIASMTAGMLAAEGHAPQALILIAPGSIIKDACQLGKFFNATFDPADPPEYIRCYGIFKLGREYLVSAQDLDIYGTSSAYEGPVLVLHGSKDKIIPIWCSRRYVEVYGERSTLEIIEGESHTITRRRHDVASRTSAFFQEHLK